ncbi:hypothetical protein BJ878DRAFT_527433 [Calycina marina]|uniref:Asl1-like glycosyl hydrolase catalytic domain-containing protein n=1 Tax=Calycina marina TaxID=1763456 RepID=A0A9P7YV22_9HELO|nr:hypothetical protein BJ878DRAFT_527433 [Calycina marina]
MVMKKRSLLWDWTSTANIPSAMENIDFNGYLSSCSNWNAWAPPELKDRLPFRPMVRGIQQITDPNEWNMISNNNHSIIHYFNEPERASISPEEAVNIWMEKIVPLRKEQGKEIIGPGCASDPAGEAWLDVFMARVEKMNEAPDYLSLHYYGPNGAAAIQYIQKM